MSLQQYLKVVICFIILTDLTKFLLQFFVDEVFEERGVTDVRRIKRDKSSSLWMPKAPQVNISKDTQASKLGDAPVGIPSFFFNKYRYTSVFVLSAWFVSFVFLFFFKNHASVRCPFINLYNTSYASLISFKYDLIELLVVHHLNLWVWFYRMLHVLHLYILSLDIG